MSLRRLGIFDAFEKHFKSAFFGVIHLEYLEKLQQEGEVNIEPMPKSVIDAARTAADEVIAEYAAGDEFAGRVYASIQEFRRKAGPWAEMTEGRFYEEMM